MASESPGVQIAVSVCIPTYQGARHIRAAIDSVLSQTFRDLELLVVDDGSDDGTLEIAASYQDPRIRILRNPVRLGPEGNWNRCLQEAAGAYFKLLPQDDTLAPTCVAEQVAVLEADKAQSIALVFCARTIIDDHDRVIPGPRRYPGRRERRLPGLGLVRKCIRFGTNLLGEPGSVLFRRRLAESVGSFDAFAPYVIDLDYWCRLLRNGDAYYLPRPLASFRVSAQSWSVAIGKRQYTDFHAFIAKLQSDPVYGIGPSDAATGRILSVVYNYLRIAFYFLFIH